MPEGKEVNVHLNVIAAVKGLKSFEHIGKALRGVKEAAGLADFSLAKLGMAGAALAVGWKGLTSIGDFMQDAKKEAWGNIKAQEKLQSVLGRNPKLAKLGADVVKEQADKLTELADKQERAGVTAGSAMMAGYAKLGTAGFGPASIAKMSKGLEGMVIAMKGIGASKDDVAGVGTVLKGIIKSGIVPKTFIKQGLITAKELATIKAAGSERARAAIVTKMLERQEWRVAAAVDSSAGKVARANLAWDRLKGIIGEPFVRSEIAFADGMAAIGDALEPVAQTIANFLTPAINGMGEALKTVPGIMKGVGAGAQAAWNSIKTAFTGATGWLDANLIKPIGTALVPVFNPLKKAADGIWKAIEPSLQSVVLSTKQFFKGDISLADYGKNLKRAFERAFEELGKIDWIKVGSDIKAGIEKIDWTGIATTLQTLAKQGLDKVIEGYSNAGNLLNNAIHSIDWSGVGAAIKDGLTIAWDTGATAANALATKMTDAVSKVNWEGVATAVGEGINTAITRVKVGVDFAKGLFASVDWKGGTSAISEGITTAFQSIPSMVSAAGDLAKKITQDIGIAMKTIQWGEVGKLIGEGLGNIVKAVVLAPAAIGQFVGKLTADLILGVGRIKWVDIFKFGDAIDQVLQSAVDAGIKLAGGLAEGIVKGITGMDFGQIGVAFLKGLEGLNIWGLSNLAKNWREGLEKSLAEAAAKKAAAPPTALPTAAAAPAAAILKPEIAEPIEKGTKALGDMTQQVPQVNQSLATTQEAAQSAGNAFSNWTIPVGTLLANMDSLITKAREVASAVASISSVPSVPVPGKQYGGLVASPMIAHLAERGPEMVIPMQGDSRSRGLLSRTATALGMGRSLGGGGGGSINLSVSVPVSISSVPAGQEGAIGREIQNALQDPIGKLLEQLRKAKDEEQRLAYV